MMVYLQGQQALDRLLLQLSHRSMTQQYQTQQVHSFNKVLINIYCLEIRRPVSPTSSNDGDDEGTPAPIPETTNEIL